MHSIEQHRLRKLIGFRTECHANSGPGVLRYSTRRSAKISRAHLIAPSNFPRVSLSY